MGESIQIIFLNFSASLTYRGQLVLVFNLPSNKYGIPKACIWPEHANPSDDISDHRNAFNWMLGGCQGSAHGKWWPLYCQLRWPAQLLSDGWPMFSGGAGFSGGAWQIGTCRGHIVWTVLPTRVYMPWHDTYQWTSCAHSAQFSNSSSS